MIIFAKDKVSTPKDPKTIVLEDPTCEIWVDSRKKKRKGIELPQNQIMPSSDRSHR